MAGKMRAVAVHLLVALFAGQAIARELQTYAKELTLDTTYNVLLRCGDQRPSFDGKKTNTFAAVYGKGLKPVLDSKGMPLVAGNTDYTSYLPTDHGLISFSQQEYTPSVYYAAALEQNDEGHMRVTAVEPVDISEWDGSIRPCAGSTSPWNTHIGGEESYPDVKEFTKWIKPTEDNIESVAGSGDVAGIMNWHGIYLGSGVAEDDAALEAACKEIGTTFYPADADGKLAYYHAFLKYYRPYMIGHVNEISWKSGKSHFQKHLALGRSSFEIAYIMPDEKTVYLTDDSAGGGLMKFVAHKARDLSKGVLYAGKFKQLTSADAAEHKFDVSWIKMAETDQEYLLKIARKPLTEFNFNDIFYVAEVNADGTCPEDFKRVDWNGNTECLLLNTHTPNVEMLAAGLESRRYIPYIGATSEFTKMEGMTHDKANNRMYFSISYQRGNMIPDNEGQDDIRVQANYCGCVYGFELDKDYSIYSMYTEVCGKEITDGAGKETCSTDYPANPDNVSFMQGTDWLIISEDSDNRNQCFMVMHNVATKENVITMAAEAGAEVTGGYYQENLNGWTYVTGNFQGFPAAPMGYLGPYKHDAVTKAKKISWKPKVPMGQEYVNLYAPF